MRRAGRSLFHAFLLGRSRLFQLFGDESAKDDNDLLQRDSYYGVFEQIAPNLEHHPGKNAECYANAPGEKRGIRRGKPYRFSYRTV